MKKVIVDELKKYNERYYKDQLYSDVVTRFGDALKDYTKKINEAISLGQSADEEHFKNIVNEFLKKNFYDEDDYKINTLNKVDSVIYYKNKPEVLIETKKYGKSSEMPLEDNINYKALWEITYYFLKQTRIIENDTLKTNNDYQIKRLIITDTVKWIIIDANNLDKICKGELEKKYFLYETGRLSYIKDNSRFYQDIKEYFEKINITEKLDYLYFNLQNIYKSRKEWKNLYKILNRTYLLKVPYHKSINTHELNNNFYQELLYIMGMKEIKEKGKVFIKLDKSLKNTLANQVYNIYINDKELPEEEAIDKTFELVIIWINRLLFIKLFESQLITFNSNSDEYYILSERKISSFQDLQDLFFNVLGKKDRDYNDFYNKFEKIPYLNSSLFEKQDLELNDININFLKNENVKLKSNSVLKSDGINEKKLLTYIIHFLNSYNFGVYSNDNEVLVQSRELIDASVLGLIFEKINGYKEGAFYTPSVITEAISQKAIEQIIVRKVNEVKKWNCNSFDELKTKINMNPSLELYKELNTIINSLKICDPAVGSGHFLVSALNRIIATKFNLGILYYYNTDKLVNEFEIFLSNDNLIVNDGQGNDFIYDKNNVLSQKMQETLFNEKRIIIENCLFGVDINPKAVSICQLRLWIELLKNAYYKNGVMETLPNIDINIKCGNSLINKINFKYGEKLFFDKKKKNKSKISAVTGKRIKKSSDEYAEDKIIENIREYKSKVKQYKSTSNKEEKNSLKNNIKDIKRLITSEGIQIDLFDKKNNNDELIYFKYNPFEWAFEFPEILGTSGEFLGFDCIIGNPPFIDSTVMKKNMGDERDFLRKKYITAKGNWDLYIPFFERALNLTKPNAIIALISPNKWLSIDYAKNLRKMVYKQIEEIYDFSRFKSFDSANISAITTFFDKLEIDNIKTIRFNKDFEIESECTVNKREIEQYDNIGITLSENYKLLLKMMKDKDLLGGEDHFILENPASTSEAYELINIIEDGNYELLENEYFKFINTGTIDKFESLWGKKEIAYLGLDYKYPIVSKEKLKQKFPNRFNQACQPKLITTGIRYFEVFYDDLGEYLAGKSTIIIFSNKNYSIKWLLPILNSSLIYFYLKETYNALAMGGGVNYSTSNLGLIPLPKLSEENILKLEEITNNYNSNEKAYQCNLDDIDKFIYELYELTDQEIKIIEKFKEKQEKRET